MPPIKGDDGISGIPVPPPGTFGAWGDSKSSYGVVGTSGGPAGVYGESNLSGSGEFSLGGAGVLGVNKVLSGIGVEGRGSAIGVKGIPSSSYGRGVVGESDQGVGVSGSCHATNGVGVHGSSANGTGVLGVSTSEYGVRGYGGNIGMFAFNYTSGTNAYLATRALAADFYGDVNVRGILRKADNRFLIDHPLDPANKYLSHSSVESSDQKNLYDGIATLDGNGEAQVELPEWFTALNRDFRYQLTCIGGNAAVFVAQEIEGNLFRIAGGSTGLKVSWQVTGIRQDPWANANPLTVEAEKPEDERGTFLHPELFDQPEEKSVQWARYSQPPELPSQQEK